MGGNPYSPKILEAKLEGGKNDVELVVGVGKPDGVGTLAGDGVLDSLLTTSVGDIGVWGSDKRWGIGMAREVGGSTPGRGGSP